MISDPSNIGFLIAKIRNALCVCSVLVPVRVCNYVLGLTHLVKTFPSGICTTVVSHWKAIKVQEPLLICFLFQNSVPQRSFCASPELKCSM